MVRRLANRLERRRKLSVTLQGHGATRDQTWHLDLEAQQTLRQEVTLALADRLSPGRHVLSLTVTEGEVVDGGDAFVVVEVER